MGEVAHFMEVSRMQEDPKTPDAGADEPKGDAPPQPLTSEQYEAKLAERETESKKLRDELREASAKLLGKDHNLPDEVVGLLATLPRDQQEERAKAVAEALGQRTPAEPKPEEPKDAAQVAAMDEGADKGDAPKAPAMPGDETLGRIKEIDPRDATERLKEIQREALGKLRGTL